MVIFLYLVQFYEKIIINESFVLGLAFFTTFTKDILKKFFLKKKREKKAKSHPRIKSHKPCHAFVHLLLYTVHVLHSIDDII